ncbi:MAG: 2Fe-2S iron-sulfur cluster binding domain-containing protein [Bacteroidetes bacterium]|nr:MAG: 2Fe-2S iron-sulfur cluster binding domain-containing protein [Bacteroidota bacterium]
MKLFNGIFGAKKTESQGKGPRGFHQLRVKEVRRVTADSASVTFDVPESLMSTFRFRPGQYIDLSIEIGGKEERRSYSLCSQPESGIEIAVKAVEGGLVSRWLNEQLASGAQLWVSEPRGNFTIPEGAKSIVAFAGGSGITPIMSMARQAVQEEYSMQLFYANKTLDSVMFKDELEALNNLSVKHYLTREEHSDHSQGRLDQKALSELVKENLDLLKADAFMLCGPAEMIEGIRAGLKLFGVPEERVHFELFTTPETGMESNDVGAETDFHGKAQVEVILDGEKIPFELESDGQVILDAVNDQGYDAPYSCRGAVCCTCKAKVIEGKARMTMNYSLTDDEVQEGYILTCQAHPASERLKITYDA